MGFSFEKRLIFQPLFSFFKWVFNTTNMFIVWYFNEVLFLVTKLLAREKTRSHFTDVGFIVRSASYSFVRGQFYNRYNCTVQVYGLVLTSVELTWVPPSYTCNYPCNLQVHGLVQSYQWIYTNNQNENIQNVIRVERQKLKLKIKGHKVNISLSYSF